MSKKFSHSTIQALSTVLFNCKKQKEVIGSTGFVFEAFTRPKTASELKDCHFLCPRIRPYRCLVPGRERQRRKQHQIVERRLPPDGTNLIKKGRRIRFEGEPQFLLRHYVSVSSLTTFAETKDLVIQRLTLWAQYLELILRESLRSVLVYN